MKLLKITFLMFWLFQTISVNAESEACKAISKMSYHELRAYISRVSIMNYTQLISSRCPCPFSYDNILNTTCGQNSAFSKSGGRALKCYAHNVTFIDIANFKADICSGASN